LLRFKSAAAPVNCAIYPSGQAVIKVDVDADTGTLAESEAFACDIDLAQVTAEIGESLPVGRTGLSDGETLIAVAGDRVLDRPVLSQNRPWR
jgi:hypothetical protein